MWIQNHLMYLLYCLLYQIRWENVSKLVPVLDFSITKWRLAPCILNPGI
jgi:hypothetical protein